MAVAYNGGRVLNANGKEVSHKIHIALATVFSIVMIFYAAFRGQKVVTQLSATFRITSVPKQLSLGFLNQFFERGIADTNFELPELTICPAYPKASLSLISCNTVASLVSTPCAVNTTNILTSVAPVMTSTKSNMTCLVIDSQVNVLSLSDKMTLLLNVNNLTSNVPNGVLVAGSPKSQRTWQEGNMISAQPFAFTEVLVSKIYTINTTSKGAVHYELKALTAPIGNVDLTNLSISTLTNQNVSNVSTVDGTSLTSNPVIIEVRYPAMEVTYEKTFAPYDFNNWLGEIGGIMAFLYFLYTVTMMIATYFLLKSGKYSVANLGQSKDETFDRFNTY